MQDDSFIFAAVGAAVGAAVEDKWIKALIYSKKWIKALIYNKKLTFGCHL